LDNETRRDLVRKKLCFTCKDPWVLSHKCMGKGEIHYIEVACSVPFHYSGVPNPLGLTIHYMDVKTNAFNQNSTLLKPRVKYMGTAIINHSIAFIINSFTQRKT
jgi:hypothetical protein